MNQGSRDQCQGRDSLNLLKELELLRQCRVLTARLDDHVLAKRIMQNTYTVTRLLFSSFQFSQGEKYVSNRQVRVRSVTTGGGILQLICRRPGQGDQNYQKQDRVIRNVILFVFCIIQKLKRLLAYNCCRETEGD